MPAWLALLPLAHAGGWEDLATLRDAGPDLAIACADARAGWTALAQVAGVTGIGRVGALDLARGVEVFDPDSRLLVGFATDGGGMTLRFTTGAAAEEVARRWAALDPSGEREVSAGAGGWEVRSPGGGRWSVEVSEGWARIEPGDPPARAPLGPPRALIDALPAAAEGCLAWAHFDPDEGEALDAAALLPLQAEAPIRFAVLTPALGESGAVAFAPGPPQEVHSQRSPDGLLILGLGLDGVDFSRFVGGRDLRELRRLQALFPVGAGSMLALVPGAPPAEEPSMVMVLPLPARWPAKKVGRRAMKALGVVGARVAKVDATHFVADVGGTVLHAAATEGRLVLTDDVPLLYDVVRGTGPVWAQGDVAEAAARYPLVLVSSILPAPGGTRHVDPPIRLALDLRAGVLHGELLLPLGFDELVEAWKALGAWLREP